jgi:NADH-quinone oxidoreductase subunit M
VFGAIANPKVAELDDIEAREWLFLAVLALLVLWMGLHPAPFNEVLEVPVADLLEHVAKSKLP